MPTVECECLQRREDDMHPLELQEVVSCLVWMLGTKLGSSVRLVCTLNHRAISPGPVIYLFIFSRYGFSIAMESVLELALVDQAGLKLTKIHLPLPPESWD